MSVSVSADRDGDLAPTRRRSVIALPGQVAVEVHVQDQDHDNPSPRRGKLRSWTAAVSLAAVA